ncbi:SPFH domain-containing protein [Amnibacterium flavum]|uniref:Flotillin family protein n=1 Tax=Amnibacterium flavum TaxID=2173173 RepID=A0A2V1HSQ5_9MICO|nr:flotillin family protein [Amnibacterium flavum]PVZ93990.1 flotillin family protein [Amnibacterium flavum]
MIEANSDLIGPAILIGVIVVVALIVLVVVLRGIKVAKPDEAIIVTSRQKGAKTGSELDENAGQRVVFGSRVFVKPVVEAYFKLSLRSRQLNVQATAQTRDAITIRVNAVAVVKVGGSESMVRAAAQRFLNQQDQIESSTEEVLSGSVRSIVGQLTVTEIITNRSALQGQVLEAVRESLDVQGLQIDTLQIKEIDDDNGYIRDLGRGEAARVKQVAEIAESVSRQASEEARIGADQAVAESQRRLDLRRAEIQKETDKARAEAAAAAPLAEAIAQQEVVAQQEVTAGKRVGLRKQELDAEIRAVADAEAYSIQKKAEADAAAAIANANALRDARKSAAEAIETEGVADRNRRRAAAEAIEAEGLADKNRRFAAAEALRAEGEAEAASIRATGTAEAEATRAKAEALAEQSLDLLRQQIIAQLPEIVRAAGEPLAGVGQMTIISSEGNPTSALNQSVSGQLATSTQIIKDLVGIDIADLITGRATGTAIGEAISESSPRSRRKPTTDTAE